MSGNNGGPRRTAPLIARPQQSYSQQAPFNHHQPGGNQLGNAIAGALGSMGMGMNMGMGMGMGWPQQPQHQPQPQPQPQQMWNKPAGLPQRPQAPMAMNHPLPINPYVQQQQPHQQYGQQMMYPWPQQQQFHQPYSAQPYPPPPPQQQFYPSPPPNNFHGYPPQPQPPRTTADGYTLSDTYVPPPPSAPSHHRPPTNRPPQGPRASNNQGRRDGPGPRPSGSSGGHGNAPPPSMGKLKCKQEGCSFEGSHKLLREHEEDRHLIYAPGREPKPWAPSAKYQGARIEGTNLSLDSPEAIAKWIAERKQKWPSAKVVEEKEKHRAERIAAGLEAPPRQRGGRNGRGRRNDRGGRGGGGRGGGRGDADAGWGRQSRDGPPATKKVKLETSSSGSDSTSSSSESENSDSDDDSDDDDDAPPEASSSKLPVPALDSEPPPPSSSSRGPSIHPSRLEASLTSAPTESEDATSILPKKEFQVVCKQWRKGSCALGEECPYLHSLPPNSTTLPTPKKRHRPAPAPPPHNPFARVDPFAQLAERDISHVVSDVLHVLDFLKNNDWLKGVETRVGQLDEEGGIEVLKSEEIPMGDESCEKVDAKPKIVILEEVKKALLEDEDDEEFDEDDHDEDEFDGGEELCKVEDDGEEDYVDEEEAFKASLAPGGELKEVKPSEDVDVKSGGADFDKGDDETTAEPLEKEDVGEVKMEDVETVA